MVPKLSPRVVPSCAVMGPGTGVSRGARPPEPAARRVRSRRIQAVFGPAVLAALVIALPIAGWTSPAGAGTEPTPHWPANPAWQRYVPAPPTPEVAPTAIITTSGDVTGAQSLVGALGGGRATLTDKEGSTAPSITVDYGEDVSGIPYFDVRSARGSPTLRATYSEARQYLGSSGDNTPSSSGAGDSSRVDQLIAAPGLLTTDLIQGAQRYERIGLTSPGSVTLSALGIDFTAVRASAPAYKGWFASSSPLLDRIWYDGAYTTQLDELPARSVPAAWAISHGALRVVEGAVGLLAAGTAWSDYTLAFDTRVLDQSTSWVVRASSPSAGYLFVLQVPSGQSSGPTLTEAALGPSEFSVIARIELPAGLAVEQWHHIATQVSGSRITTSIDGKRVATFDTAMLPSGASVYDTGTIGLTSYGSAMYRDLRVTAAGDTVLYDNTLARSSALAAFTGPDVTTPDPLPVVVDGAKRDRVVWSGDLGTEGPTIFYSTDNSNFLRGSLELLGSYQVADGQTGTNVDPTAGLGSYPEVGSTYSASYSMDEVLDIATYYLYTGDLSFVRTQWPMITRELAYDQSLVDSRGLLATDADDGQDWDYYDGSKLGDVTAYNVIYYETLVAAAGLANALALPDPAAQLSTEATALKTAVNRYLFDPASGLYGLSNLEPSAVAQDANSLAVTSGVAAPTTAGRLLSALAKALPNTPYGPNAFTADAGYRTQVSPFATNEEVQALFTTDRTAAALSLIETLWGHMDAPGPDDTKADWELVGADGSPGFGPGTSLAHGWASGATADLSAYVLGVRPASAGFRQWVVQPHPGSISWVEGDVPTPHGSIDVRWAQERSTGRLAMQVAAPPGTGGVISVPVPPSGAIITVHAAGPGAPRTSTRIAVSAGVAFRAITAHGGVTYRIDVEPR